MPRAAAQLGDCPQGQRPLGDAKGPVAADGPGGCQQRLAEQGLGLAYTFEPAVEEKVRSGRRRRVLEAYAPKVPGFFLYYPGVAPRSALLRLFIEVAREQTSKRTQSPPGAPRASPPRRVRD